MTDNLNFTAINVGRVLEAKSLSERVRYLKVVIEMLPEQEREATLLAALDGVRND